MATGLQSPVVDHLALTMLAARIGQTLTHIALPPTNVVSSFRFALFFLQVVCMIAMGVFILVTQGQMRSPQRVPGRFHCQRPSSIAAYLASAR
jgi:hypothetical protein